MNSTTTPIPTADQTWLHMDRPNNLMHVHGLMRFAEPPDWDAVRAVIQQRLVDLYPVFSQRPVNLDGGWHWQVDPEFSLDRHVHLVDFEGADLAQLRAYVSAGFAEPLDSARPLWRVDLISNVADEQGPGTYVFTRFHHALADGIRCVQLLLSLCDVEGEALPPIVGRSGGSHQLADLARRTAGDVADLVGGVGTGLLRAPAVLLSPKRIYRGLDKALRPTKWLDLVSGLASEANATVNTFTETARILIAGRSVETVWSGTPGVEKRVDWVSGLSLKRVKKIGKRYDATVNDVLLATVSRALTRYLMEHGRPVDEISWLVPVSLVPMDANLPPELGNHFSLVFLPMPLGIESPKKLFAAIRSRMNRIKNSAEPVVTFGVQRVVAESPQAMATALTNLFANKGVGVLTNVPGPKAPMSLAGTPITSVLGWAPTSGDQPLSLCIFSYNGQVSIGIAADATLIPDPHRIAALVEEEFGVLAAVSRA